jgi:hypothetical protein
VRRLKEVRSSCHGGANVQVSRSSRRGYMGIWEESK